MILMDAHEKRIANETASLVVMRIIAGLILIGMMTLCNEVVVSGYTLDAKAPLAITIATVGGFTLILLVSLLLMVYALTGTLPSDDDEEEKKIEAKT